MHIRVETFCCCNFFVKLQLWEVWQDANNSQKTGQLLEFEILPENTKKILQYLIGPLWIFCWANETTAQTSEHKM